MNGQLRGTIIKTPDSTPGLLFLDGKQMPFTLVAVWHSGVAPEINMPVDVELDPAGGIVAICAVDPQQLARERLQQLSTAAHEHSKRAAGLTQQGIGVLAGRMGKAALVCTAVLWIGWFFLPFCSYSLNLLGVPATKSFTFWQYLGMSYSPGTLPPGVNLDGTPVSTHGAGSLLGLLAIAAPFAAPFLRDPRAKLLNGAPFVYLVLFGLHTAWEADKAQRVAALAAQSNPMIGIFTGLAKDAGFAVSLEYGALLLLAASLVLATRMFKRSGA